MTTKDQIVDLLKTRDLAVARALVVLYEHQTADEQVSHDTHHRNGMGFRPCDAHIGTSMAQFYLKNKFLTQKQLDYWRKPMRNGQMKIEIYANQLLKTVKGKQNG